MALYYNDEKDNMFDTLMDVINARIQELSEEYEEYGDYDELVENVASGGNHDDTFRAGESYGMIFGEMEGLRFAKENLKEIYNA